MKQFLNVRGSQEKIPNLEVNVDTVYIRSNIKQVTTEDFIGWEYDEIQYSLNEYQEKLGNKTDGLTQDVNEVAEMVVVSIDDLTTIADLLANALVEIEILKGGI